ncbi:hypothetical protein BD779DRAFT_1546730 [Infundibulicybe gibba]|nr:hypothetical protein BD779DRAFT_1546730 [Infundibulicybe gibba]
MSTDVQLILDEMSNSISYGGGQWSVHTDIRWFGGTCIAGTALDFAIITLGANTTLSGNPKIIRSGDPFITSEGPNGRSFHNGTHQSSTPGDTATFRFAGTSIGVYGVFSWVNTGSLGVTYTLNGISTASTYPVTPTTPEYVNKLRQHPNYMFFSNDSLPAGNHSLVIKITQASGPTFSMDYITYKPSFPSLDLKPNLTDTSASSTSKSGGKSAPSVGGIIGAILGALVLLSSVVALLFVLQRRRRQQELEESTKITPSRQRSPF